MRITRWSWLLVLVGGALFGAALIGVARVLPSGNHGDAAVTIVDTGRGIVLTPVSGASDSSSEPIGSPPLSALEKADTSSPPGLRVLDLRIVDETLRDRNGNAPKRALTSDELRTIATSHDIVADDLTAQPDGTPLTPEEIAAMHAINPSLRVVRVLETLTSNDPAYAGIRPDDGTHSTWFLSDGTGEPALVYGGNAAWNGQPNFVMDPANSDVRTAIAARARQFIRLGYDGVWLRGVSSHAPAFAVAPVLDPATRAPYTDAAWRDATTGLVAAVRRLTPNAPILAPAGDVDPTFAADSGIIAARW